MAITIDGSGTISGVSVGGLPDGIVDTDMLASNAVTTAKITDGNVTSAKVGTIAESNMPAGTVVQVVRQLATWSVHWSTASTSWIELAGMSVTITPKFSNSLILVSCQAFLHAQQDSMRFAMTYFCNGSNIASTTQGTICYYGSGNDTADNTYDSFQMSKFHSPGSTSSQTYSLRAYKLQGSQALYVHEGGDNFVMAMEIKQ
jgi:hypothetical protein